MTYRIPSIDKRISQPNSSDVKGNIFATRNIDFDEEGYIKLSQGTVSIFSESDDADFRNVQSMFHGSDVYFVGAHLFRKAEIALYGNLTDVSDTDVPTPGIDDDGVFFNGTDVVSDGNTIKYLNTGDNTWDTISGTPTATGPVCLEVFPLRNSLLIGRGNVVQRYDTSWSKVVEMTLPSEYSVTSIAVNGNYAYIATRHTGNGEAMLFLWAGLNTGNDGCFGIGAAVIMSVKTYGSSVVCITSLGQLMRFNGSGFDELASLPVYYASADWQETSTDYGGITHRGMVVDGDLIYLHIENAIADIENRYMPQMPGGVWCYDPKVGLYHKFSVTNSVALRYTLSGSGDVDIDTDTITLSGTVPETGTPVFYATNTTPITGLQTEHWYYTIRVTGTTFRLAETLDDALNGVPVSLTSYAGTVHDFRFLQQKDYGDVVPGSRNSILVLSGEEYATRQVGRVLFTGDAYDASGTQVTRLNVTCPLMENRGYFVTPKMFASNTTDTFNSLTVRFRPLKFGDEIIIKYRDTERLNMPAAPRGTVVADHQATWISTSVFTTPSAPSQNYYDLSTVEVGDEIEVISGAGAGHIAHVAEISRSGFQYTVTLDEACPLVSANDKMMFIASNYKRLDTIDHTHTQNWKTVSVDTPSDWVQFKIELRGRGVAIEDNIIDHKSHAQSR